MVANEGEPTAQSAPSARVHSAPSAAAYWRRRVAAFGVAVGLVVGAGSAAMSIGRALVGGEGDRSLTVTAAGAAPGAPTAATPATDAAGSARVHVVGPGDTLWSIAGAMEPEGDIRATVDRLAAANGGAELQVGQRILLD